jgi:MinD-like ATPase involved in chromosome partitioning or flagellar assembly
MTKAIGIISVKGGSGKTSVAGSLGAVMAKKFGKKVLLVDGSFSAPNLGMQLGLDNPEFSIHQVLDGKIKAKDAVYTSDYGFDILPGESGYGKINPLKLSEKIRELRRYYDVILMDSSPNLNEEVLGVMMASDELLAVTTPDHVTLASTIRAIRTAKARRTPITGIILNKVYDKDFELSVQQIEDVAGCNVLAVLPHDVNVMKALSENIPASLHKDNKLAKEYEKLAASLVGESVREGFFDKLKRKFSSDVPKHEVNQTIFQNQRRTNPFYQ